MSPSSNFRVLVPVAEGTEEIEAVCIIDVLRRAGAEVTVASAGSLQITASRGVRLVADSLLSRCVEKSWDLIALPGGMPGAENLARDPDLTELLRRQKLGQGWIGAICAAPAVVLAAHGLLEGIRATAHPAFVDRLPLVEAERVVIDQRVVTSCGPGSALEFALALVACLMGPEKAAEVAAPMQMPPGGCP